MNDGNLTDADGECWCSHIKGRIGIYSDAVDASVDS
jgi:hypothetical protein